MATGNSYHHGDLHAALLDEAAAQLEDVGVEAISLRGLARALGVSHAAPAHHFASRAALLAEVAAGGYELLAEGMEGAMEGREQRDWRPATGRAYVAFALANPERYRLMFTSRLAHQDQTCERLNVQASRSYMALLRAAYGREPDVDPATYRMAAPELQTWSVVHGAVMLWLDGQLGPDLSEGDFLARMEEVLAP